MCTPGQWRGKTGQQGHHRVCSLWRAPPCRHRSATTTLATPTNASGMRPKALSPSARPWTRLRQIRRRQVRWACGQRAEPCQAVPLATFCARQIRRRAASARSPARRSRWRPSARARSGGVRPACGALPGGPAGDLLRAPDQAACGQRAEPCQAVPLATFCARQAAYSAPSLWSSLQVSCTPPMLTLSPSRTPCRRSSLFTPAHADPNRSVHHCRACQTAPGPVQRCRQLLHADHCAGGLRTAVPAIDLPGMRDLQSERPGSPVNYKGIHLVVLEPAMPHA